MKVLTDLTQDQLTYLRKQWIADIAELERTINERNFRLDRRIERSEDRTGVIAEITERLENAQLALNELIEAGGSAPAIASMETVVQGIQTELDETSNGAGGINPIDAQEELIEIRTLERKINLLEDSVAEIEGLLEA